MDFKQGEIVLLPFPFDDLSGAKKRQVLVISSNDFNKISRTLIVVEITSNLKSGFRGLNIRIEDEDVSRYPNTKPLIPSIIKPYVVFSVNKRLVQKRIGVLKDEKLKEVLSTLEKIFEMR
ncbi:MAG: type II toxin-antitoxin system PemK/MazF family toxin [Thermococci archaeon]|nr:type II toxin-antitoxin system PemK/MazF family toxin [Thermococci archaeon]